MMMMMFMLLLQQQIHMAPRPVASWTTTTAKTTAKTTLSRLWHPSSAGHSHRVRGLLPSFCPDNQNNAAPHLFTFAGGNNDEDNEDEDNDDENERRLQQQHHQLLRMDVVASSGLTPGELALILDTLQTVLEEETGMVPSCSSLSSTSSLSSSSSSSSSSDSDSDNDGNEVRCRRSHIPGATGRVLLVHVNLDSDSLETVRAATAEKLDVHVVGVGVGGGGQQVGHGHGLLTQPVLLKLRNNNNNNINDDDDDSGNDDDITTTTLLANLIRQEVKDYGLRDPIGQGKTTTPTMAARAQQRQRQWQTYPTLQIELDGAYVADMASAEGGGDDDTGDIGYDIGYDNDVAQRMRWDTSSILVFDGLVDDDLRRRLLQAVVLGNNDNDNERQQQGGGGRWNDVEDGPDPRRWERGGLIDIPEDDDAEDGSSTTPRPLSSWGLQPEAIEELCCREGVKDDAIEEMETILAMDLFPHFDVCRLPEAVFGCGVVSPLTANAPTASGEQFSYHIDGDPALTPPSPWTDVYGRYPNRTPGRPRFMSLLVYLNDEWDGPAWGAPTRFLDVLTGTHVDVEVRPGRCVLMDQDVSHTVVPPHGETAGWNRPRYSLVWKLLLHPKENSKNETNEANEQHTQTNAQDMKDLSNGREWDDPILFGSALKLTSQ